MKLYLISQNENNNYDTYDSAVVAAENEDIAKNFHPCNYQISDDEWAAKYKYGSWAFNREKVKVEYLGEAKEGTAAGVVCASFNAG